MVLIVSCMTICPGAWSQSRTFENIQRTTMRSSGTILENNEISGYYILYDMDKAKKGNRTYLLEILDENLDRFKTTTLEEGKSVYLTESVFNGEAIMLKFVDMKQKRLIFMAYSKGGDLLSKTEKELTKRETRLYGIMVNAQTEGNALNVIDGKGFVDYGMDDNGKKYVINYMPSDPEKKGWRKRSMNMKEIENAGFLCSSNDYVYSLVAKRPSLRSTKVQFAVTAHDIEIGVKAFETGLNSSKYSAQPMSGYFDEKTQLLNVIGIYYEPGVKQIKDNGLGLFNYQINFEGKIVNEKYLSWAQDFRKYVKVDNKGRISNENRNGFIYFHRIVQNPDGSIIAIGEQYKKTADAAGIAVAALGGAASTTKVVIQDMVVFHFTKDFNIAGVEMVEKSKSNFILPQGYDFMNIHLLSNVVKANGGFDYSFCSQNKRDESTSIGYVDYERKKGARNEFVFGALTYYDGQFSKDKIPLGKPRDKDWIRVLPGKPGYVMLLEYSKKEKTLESRLERINF